MEALHDNSWHVKSTDEEMKEATEWLQKTEQLEKQYRDELLRRDDYECSACAFLADRYFTACPRCSASLEHAEYET